MNLINKFKEPLKNFFEEKEINDLYQDYLIIEKHWDNFFRRMDFINLVIIAEAPLSGEGYIYNPDSKKNNDGGSQFLYKKQLCECLEIYKKSDYFIEGKGKMELMIELGLLVIEAYPYALDPKRHKNNFKKGLGVKKTDELFMRTKSWHFYNKIKQINHRFSSVPTYAFRYRGNMHNLNPLIEMNEEIHCIGGDYGNLNSKELHKIYKNFN
jgi:hypothetical protein